MGGGLTLSFLMRNNTLKIAGVIVSGPLLHIENLDLEKQVFLYLMGKKLKYFIYLSGILHLSTVSITYLTSDENKYFDIINDRLMAPILGIGLARELLKLCRYNIPRAKRFNLPLLIC